ncbi:MAG: zf-TFIIB domain-containing protein [Gemmatimonadaceae bacterium]
MPTDEKPSKNEDEYFARQNLEIIREMRARLDAERRKVERHSHHNKCPRCGADLREEHAEHVKIDECTECGGIWLDKGEFEQLRRVNRARGVSGGVLGSLFRRGAHEHR